ncbi:MAG: SsrA-binding protein SmpB [Candidatus Izemoplasmatales bacterium]|jgi:SsrA-binding protein|nr:SsrA-binding protein SmpB [Candidatus Izemoplasmatales bacterium]
MKILANNKKVGHDYYILETFECGIVLKGTEIKSIRLGKFSINEAYVKISNDFQAYIINMHVAKYEQGNIFNHKETRNKKLLLSKREIIKLSQKLKLEGLTLVPTKVYLNEGLCKIEIALCKGKKLYDKRESQKEKDATKRMEKVIKY